VLEGEANMHELVSQRPEVLRVLRETIRLLEKDQASTRRAGMARLAVRSSVRWPDQRDRMVGKLQRAYQWAESDTALRAERATRTGIPEETWYMPRNRAIALLQTAMDEHQEQRLARAKKARAAPERIARLGEQFDTSDPGWVSVALERIKALFTRDARFIKHKSPTDFRFPLAPQARIALLADWGTGTPHARAVADQIRARNPDHVMHLGDVYYSGTPEEIQKRFLAFWPAPQAPGRSWALNSNHEMYSGGHGYFKKTLKTFKQPASYFNLRNQHWRIIGLDTGYVDHSLNREQVEWLAAQLKESAAKTILLSHHQLFSAYEAQGEKLEEWCEPFLQAGQIYGWFWGHEHKCVLYGPYKGLKGRCIGHGGIPFGIPSQQPPNPEVPVEWVDRRPRPDNPNRGLHGFALLTLDGPNLHVEYVGEDGTVGHAEDL